MYIDSHAHLFQADYGSDRNEVIQRAQDSGVDSIIVPATSLETSREGIELAERYECVYACVGIHPHEAVKATEKDLLEIESLSVHRKVVAIGEIGLDFHYDFTPKDKQREVFSDQVSIAVRRNLPVVVHTRESLEETFGFVERLVHDNPKWIKRNDKKYEEGILGRGVFHCFTGSAQEAVRLFQLGFYVSFPGIVTFKNSPVIHTIRQIGDKNILLETDSPYMTPVPLRGRRNEPANIAYIGKKIAETLEVNESEIAKVTSQNAMELFNLPDHSQS